MAVPVRLVPVGPTIRRHGVPALLRLPSGCGLLIADDYFAGPGGWDLAAVSLGITARGIENARWARATRDAAGLTTIHDDVWTYVPDGLARLQIASPPCPPFSTAGKGPGHAGLPVWLDAIRTERWRHLDRLGWTALGDPVAALVLTPLHFLLRQESAYELAAWEQVPTALPIWEECARVLEAHGWGVTTGVVQAHDHQVPQSRRRAVLLARRDGVRPSLPAPSPHPARSMSSAIGWGWVHRPSFTVNGGGHRASHSGHEWGSGASRKTLLAAAESGDHTVWKPIPAHRLTGRRNDQIRLQPHEAGVLQTFPVHHPWQGPGGHQFLQAGNAVPVLLARALLTALTGRRHATDR